MKFASRKVLALRSIVAASCVLCLMGCDAGASQDSPAQRYLEVAIADLQDGIYANGADWESSVEDARAAAELADEPEDLYDTLRTLVKTASGRHGAFYTKQEWVGAVSDAVHEPEVFDESGLIRVAIPAFGSDRKDDRDAFARSVREDIARSSGCGVALDFRGNSGGDIFGMIGAVAPLLPNGKLLGVEVGDVRGSLTLEEDRLVMQDASTYVAKLEQELRHISVDHIAMLQDRRTASAAEITIAALSTRPGVRVFGSFSAGVASGNTIRELPDGARLLVTDTRFSTDDSSDITNGVVPDGSADAGIAWLRDACA